MDDNSKSRFSKGIFGMSNPSMGIPVTGTTSPFTSIDPSLLMSPGSQFILPEGATPQRGRFELSFCVVGGAVLAEITNVRDKEHEVDGVAKALVPQKLSAFIPIKCMADGNCLFNALSYHVKGGFLGGTNFMLRNPPLPKTVFSSPVARSEYTTHAAKSISASAQRWGSAALIYSIYVVALSKIRGVDDDINTLLCGSAAGATFYAAGGLRRAGLGAIIGGVFATGYCLATNKERFMRMLR